MGTVMGDCPIIMAIVQEHRTETAVKVQDILTKYGCYIRVRLGLHDAAMLECTNSGIILLQLCGESIPIEEMEKELQAVPNVKVRHMSLNF